MSWHAINVKDNLRHELAPLATQDPDRKHNTGTSFCGIPVKASPWSDDTEKCNTCKERKESYNKELL